MSRSRGIVIAVVSVVTLQSLAAVPEPSLAAIAAGVGICASSPDVAADGSSDADEVDQCLSRGRFIPGSARFVAFCRPGDWHPTKNRPYSAHQRYQKLGSARSVYRV